MSTPRLLESFIFYSCTVSAASHVLQKRIQINLSARSCLLRHSKEEIADCLGSSGWGGAVFECELDILNLAGFGFN